MANGKDKDKLKKLYNLYVDKELITPSQDKENKFLNANKEQVDKLWKLGVDKDLFSGNKENDFYNAFGVKKKEDGKSASEAPLSLSKTKPSDVELDKEFAKTTVENNRDVPFVKRITDPDIVEPIKNKDGSVSTHKLAWGSSDDGYVVYPTVQTFVNPTGKAELQEIEDEDEAYKRAKATGNIIKFDNEEEAKAFADGAWKDFYGDFKEPDIKETITDRVNPDTIVEVPQMVQETTRREAETIEDVDKKLEDFKKKSKPRKPRTPDVYAELSYDRPWMVDVIKEQGQYEVVEGVYDNKPVYAVKPVEGNVAAGQYIQVGSREDADRVVNTFNEYISSTGGDSEFVQQRVYYATSGELGLNPTLGNTGTYRILPKEEKKKIQKEQEAYAKVEASGGDYTKLLDEREPIISDWDKEFNEKWDYYIGQQMGIESEISEVSSDKVMWKKTKDGKYVYFDTTTGAMLKKQGGKFYSATKEEPTNMQYISASTMNGVAGKLMTKMVQEDEKGEFVPYDIEFEDGSVTTLSPNSMFNDVLHRSNPSMFVEFLGTASQMAFDSLVFAGLGGASNLAVKTASLKWGSSALAKGLAKKEVVNKFMQTQTSKLLGQSAKSALTTGGTLGSYNTANEYLTQINEGKDIDDVNYKEVASQFKHGLTDGLIIGGTMGVTSFASSKITANRYRTNDLKGIETPGRDMLLNKALNSGAFAGESYVFASLSSFRERGEFPTFKEFVNSGIQLAAIKGGTKIGMGKSPVSLKKPVLEPVAGFGKENIGKGFFKVTTSQDKRYEKPELWTKDKSGKDIIDNKAINDYLKNPDIPIDTKRRVLFESAGMKFNINISPDNIAVEGNTARAYDKDGVLLAEKKHASPQEAQKDAMRMAAQAKDMALFDYVSDLKPTERVELQKKHNLTTKEFSKMWAKDPMKRSKDENKIIEDVFNEAQDITNKRYRQDNKVLKGGKKEMQDKIEKAEKVEDLEGLEVRNDEVTQKRLTDKFNQIKEGGKDAIQEQKTKEMDVRKQAEAGKEVDKEVREQGKKEKAREEEKVEIPAEVAVKAKQSFDKSRTESKMTEAEAAVEARKSIERSDWYKSQKDKKSVSRAIDEMTERFTKRPQEPKKREKKPTERESHKILVDEHKELKRSFKQREKAFKEGKEDFRETVKEVGRMVDLFLKAGENIMNDAQITKAMRLQSEAMSVKSDKARFNKLEKLFDHISEATKAGEISRADYEYQRVTKKMDKDLEPKVSKKDKKGLQSTEGYDTKKQGLRIADNTSEGAINYRLDKIRNEMPDVAKDKEAYNKLARDMAKYEYANFVKEYQSLKEQYKKNPSERPMILESIKELQKTLNDINKTWTKEGIEERRKYHEKIQDLTNTMTNSLSQSRIKDVDEVMEIVTAEFSNLPAKDQTVKNYSKIIEAEVVQNPYFAIMKESQQTKLLNEIDRRVGLSKNIDKAERQAEKALKTAHNRTLGEYRKAAEIFAMRPEYQNFKMFLDLFSATPVVSVRSKMLKEVYENNIDKSRQKYVEYDMQLWKMEKDMRKIRKDNNLDKKLKDRSYGFKDLEYNEGYRKKNLMTKKRSDSQIKKMNLDEVIYLEMFLQNPTNLETMKSKYRQESIDKLIDYTKKTVDESGAREYVKYLQDTYFPKMYDIVNPTYRELFRTDMREQYKYIPVKVEGQQPSAIEQFLGGANAAKLYDRPSSIREKTGGGDPMLKREVTTVVKEYGEPMIGFASFGVGKQKLLQMYNSKEFQSYLNKMPKKRAKKFRKIFTTFMENIPKSNIKGETHPLSKVINFATMAKLSLNISMLPKQIVSSTNAVSQMKSRNLFESLPVVKEISFMHRAFFQDIKGVNGWKEYVDNMYHSNSMQSRVRRAGMEVDVQRFINPDAVGNVGTKLGQIKKYASMLKQAGMTPTQVGDVLAFALYRPVYADFKKELIPKYEKQGYSKEEVNRLAGKEAAELTARTAEKVQQSRYPENLSAFQMQSGFRMIFRYVTTPIQYFQQTMHGIRMLTHRESTAKDRMEGIRKIVNYGWLQREIYQKVQKETFNIMRGDFGDDDKEGGKVSSHTVGKVIEIMGGIYGSPVIGATLQYTGQVMQDEDPFDLMPPSGVAHVVELFIALQGAIEPIDKHFNGETLTDYEKYKIMKAAKLVGESSTGLGINNAEKLINRMFEGTAYPYLKEEEKDEIWKRFELGKKDKIKNQDGGLDKRTKLKQ